MYEPPIQVWCMFVGCRNSRRCPDQENCGAVSVDTCTHVTLGKYVVVTYAISLRTVSILYYSLFAV